MALLTADGEGFHWAELDMEGGVGRSFIGLLPRAVGLCHCPLQLEALHLCQQVGLGIPLARDFGGLLWSRALRCLLQLYRGDPSQEVG